MNVNWVALTVLVDLTVAIEIGMVLAVFLFMWRMAQVTNVGQVTREFTDEEDPADPEAIATRQVPPGIEVYEINGPFFFGASYKFKEAMREIGEHPKVMVIRMRNVLAMDATGLQALKEQYLDAKKGRRGFVISGIHAQPLVALERSGLLDLIGEENVFTDIDRALAHARRLLSA